MAIRDECMWVPLVLGVVGVVGRLGGVDAQPHGVLARAAQRDGQAAARRELAAPPVGARDQLVLARAPRHLRLHRAPALPTTISALHMQAANLPKHANGSLALATAFQWSSYGRVRKRDDLYRILGVTEATADRVLRYTDICKWCVPSRVSPPGGGGGRRPRPRRHERARREAAQQAQLQHRHRRPGPRAALTLRRL